jgi:hypothetical protein
MGGLLVATILTLVFLPTLYATWFGLREKNAPTEPPNPTLAVAGPSGD